MISTKTLFYKIIPQSKFVKKVLFCVAFNPLPLKCPRGLRMALMILCYRVKILTKRYQKIILKYTVEDKGRCDYTWVFGVHHYFFQALWADPSTMCN